jgi:type VI secretion system secreted protein VgrG
MVGNTVAHQVIHKISKGTAMADANSKLGNNLRFSFESGAAADNPFSVLFMEGEEALGRSFRFTLTLMAEVSKEISFDKMLSEVATLKILVPGSTDRGPVPYHGILEEFDELQKTSTTAFYRAVLVPRFARARMDRISEVYVKSPSIDQTLTKVLSATVLSGGAKDFQFTLTGNYEARESVCQYQESTFDFVSRWLEKEGMYYYFDHSAQIDKMAIVDDRNMLSADTAEVFYRPAGLTETGNADQAVQQFTCRRTRLPKQVVLQDFNYRRADVPLRLTHDVPGNGVGDVMIYGEDVRDEAQGRRYAKLRAEEIGCGGTLYFGSSTAVGLRAGYFMQMENAPVSKPPEKYLITEIEHKGSQSNMLLEGLENPFKDLEGDIFYSNNFTAIPGDVQFRPARITPRPYVAAPMSAVISAEGSSGYADLDEHGQYKVKMPFTQTEHDSARIRMATPYAGSDHGIDFPLHKGTEVLLSFINGDPDQAVIMNAAPNSSNVRASNNERPQFNRIRSAGGNQITFNDTAAKPSITLATADGKSASILGGADGTTFFTNGNTYTVSMGASNKFAAGASNGVVVGTDTSFNVSASQKMSFGASMAYSESVDIKWIGDRSFGVTVDDGTPYAYKKKSITKVGDFIQMTAGLDPLEASTKGAILDALKKRVKQAIAATAAVNVAAGLSVGIYKGVKAHMWSGKDDVDKDDMNIGFLAGQFGLAALSTAGVVAGVTLAMKKIVDEMEKLTYRSDITMNANGITQKYEKKGIASYDTKYRSTSNFSAEGIYLEANQTDALATITGGLKLNGDVGALLNAGKLGSQSGSLNLKPDGIGLLNTSKELTLRSAKAVLTSGPADLTLDAGDVNLRGTSVNIGFMATSTATVIKLDGDIAMLDIKIGNANVKLRTATDKVDAYEARAAASAFGWAALVFETGAVTAARAEVVAAQAELAPLVAQRAGFVATRAIEAAIPRVALQGVSVAQAAVKMEFNAAKVALSPASVDIAYGASSVKVGPATIEHSAPLIKLG